MEEASLGWSDDEDDEKVDNMVKLINEDFNFCKKIFRGGLTPGDLNRMRLEKKSKKKNKRLFMQRRMYVKVVMTEKDYRVTSLMYTNYLLWLHRK